MSELTPEQQRAVERRDGSLLVRAGAGTGKTTVLVERFVRAVTEDGVGVESILAITFTEKAAAEMRIRVRRRFLELGRAGGGARGRERMDLDDPRVLLARPARARAQRRDRPGLPRARRARVRAAGRRRLRRRPGGVHGRRLGRRSGSRWWRRTSRTRSATWCAPRTRTCAATASATRASTRRSRRTRPASASGSRRPRATALAELAHGDGVRPRCAKAIELRRERARPLKGRATRRRSPRTPATSTGRHSRPTDLRGGRARAPRPHDAARAARALRRALRAAQARALGARLRGPGADRARSARRARGPARGVLVALRARAGGRVPGHERAPERAAGAARAREPVPGRRREPVDLPLQARRRGRLPRATGSAPRRTAARSASP